MEKAQRTFIEDLAILVANHNHEGILHLVTYAHPEPFVGWISPGTPDVEASMAFLNAYSHRQLERVTEPNIRFRYNDGAERSSAANESVGALVLLRGILQSTPDYGRHLTELDSALIDIGDRFNPILDGDLANRLVGIRPAVSAYIGSQDSQAYDRRMALFEAILAERTHEIQYGHESVRLVASMPKGYFPILCKVLRGDNKEREWTVYNLKQRHPEVFEDLVKASDDDSIRRILEYNGSHQPDIEWMRSCP